MTLCIIEREHIARVLARASTQEAAMRILGTSSETLRRKRQLLGLL